MVSRRLAALLGAAFLVVSFILGCTTPEQVAKRAPGGMILFQDDFSNPVSGWDRISAPTGVTNYQDGFYRIWVNEPYTDLWSNPDYLFADTRIEVVAKKADGPDDNVFGIICRVNPGSDQYYFFVISSDGYYGIGKVDGSGQTLLSADQMLPHESIRRGKQSNLLSADCIGNRLIFYVNGEKISEVQDDAFADGAIGLTAGSFAQPGVDIHFDDLVVTKP